MTKFFLVLFIGLLFEAAGVTLIKTGLNQIGPVDKVSAAEIVRVTRLGLINPRVLLGIAFEGVFFLCLLFLLARGEVSFVWPLTALSFMMTTLAAAPFLREHISAYRWAGVVFIVIGAAFISYSAHAKSRSNSTEAPSASTTLSK